MWKLKDQAIPEHLLSEFGDDRLAGFSSTSKTKKGVLTKRNPFAECNNANHQPLVTSKAFKIGVFNTSSPHDQLMVDANPGFEFVSQDTTSSTVIQAGKSVAKRNLCAPRQPACGSFTHPTETKEVETDSNCCPMDEVPSTNMEFQGDQVIPAGQGVTVHDIRYGQPLSDMLIPVESVATDAGCQQIIEAPALSVADPQSVSDVPVTLHENESSVRNESSTTSFDFDLLTRVVNLPSKWRWDTVDHSCYTSIMSGKECVHKIVLITSTLLTFFMNGREFIFPFLKNKMWAHIDLQRSLVEFDTLHPCSGMLDHTLYSYRNVKSPLLTELRSLKCKKVCNRDEKQCTNYQIGEGKIKYIKMTQAQTVASQTKRLKANQRRIQRFIVYGKKAMIWQRFSSLLFHFSCRLLATSCEQCKAYGVVDETV
ncbi:hypothetical protein OUZ56_016709 [Daphnia magna]|uniref:Uncharacterized protein n=1 Tax=Daphnia magna TaxID=35525 RepID=A0ABR0ARB7_9CRUS|nr:hypothetical protein OUZ56_016709 [Daphnia magna]